MNAPQPSAKLVALGQLEPGPSLEANLAAIDRLGGEAVAGGAGWLVLPEFASFLHGSRREMAAAAARADEVTEHLGALARRLHLWILLGSLAVPIGGDAHGRMANRSLLFDADGQVVARYDKLHLFDATLPDGRQILESRGYAGGDRAVLADTPWGRIGLSICYDLRFPQLYRALARAGAEILVVPAAFARQTGPAHWHPLLTARAIECGAYVLAPATCGISPGGRDSHGHALAVDPWGHPLGELGDAPGCLFVALDPDAPGRARSLLPTLEHDRPFTVHTALAIDPILSWRPIHHVPS